MTDDARQRSLAEEYLAGNDPEAERDAEDAAAKEAGLERQYLIGLMQDPKFRAWLMGRLDDLCTFGAPIMVTPAGFPDERATWFALGQKQAGWAIWDAFDKLAPDLASLMRREGAEREALRQAMRTRRE